ncbi:MAG: SufD family Fe-S cluster assembly protein [Pseudomonadaceae bacterium]|nr:SufD family Fe-S cluster assembly protein [Pseudomonadaceae bacterium]
MADAMSTWESLPGADALAARLDEGRVREAWKYTPLRRLLNTFSSEPGGWELAGTGEAQLTPSPDQTDSASFPLGLISAQACSPRQLVISTSGDYEVRTIAFGHQQLNVFVEAGVHARLIERYPSPFQSQIINITLEAGAHLSHERLCTHSNSLWHLTDVSIGKDAHYQLMHYALGGDTQRFDCRIKLAGAHATLLFDSACALASGRHHDLTLEVVHEVPDCQSTIRAHAVAQAKAKSTCIGRIHIVPDAQRSNANLSCRNLLLADNAEVNAKPELEIYADDVRCAHGATVGRLDEDALFYLRSRGIGERQARQTLVRAFLAQTVKGDFATEALAAFDEAVHDTQN